MGRERIGVQLKKKLSEIVIMSDVDGTLLDLRHGGELIPENITALERFVLKGGKFAVATGRSLHFTRPVAELLPVNFPCIVFNGGAIYDFQKEQYITKMFLPDVAVQHAKQISKAFPDCGVIFVNDSAYLDIGGVCKEKYASTYTNALLQPTSFNEISGPFFKIFFVMPPHRRQLLVEYVKEHIFDGVRFVSSDTWLFEMLPIGSSKGAAIGELEAITGIKRENFVAIGDYYNDLEMLECVGIGVTLSDAPDDIKNVVDMIVRPCLEGSVADLVQRLELMFD